MTSPVDQFRQATALDKPLPLNVRLLQLHALFWGALFLVPVIVPYYRDVLGLGFNAFMLGEAVFAAVVIFMEIPTGWLSDIWTRKRTLMAATVANILGFVYLWQSDTLLDTLVAQAILGVSLSLMSGTGSALLYDTLLEARQTALYRKLEGSLHGIKLYLVAISSFIGGFLYQIDPELPIIMTIVTGVGALIVTLFIVEPERHKEPLEKHPFADMIETMKYALHGHGEVAAIIFLSSALFAATKILLWMQQPYYTFLDIPEMWFGALVAAGFMLGGLGGQFGHLFDRFKSNTGFVLVCFIFVIITCVISAVWPGYQAIPLLLAGSLIWGMGWPRVQDALNKRVGSGRRATILSTASLMINVMAIPLFITVGHVTETLSITTALLTLATILAISGIIAGLGLLWRKRR